MTFFMPAKQPDDWRRGLADKDKHWKVGHSAYALAYSWQNAREQFPERVLHVFKNTPFEDASMLLGLPEHEVSLDGVGKGSQNDLFVLARLTTGELASITVEGKVSTDKFDPPLSKWFDGSANKIKRLDDVLNHCGLTRDIPDITRYQLIHRTAAAVKKALQFNAKYALMLVHSFSQSDEHFDEYEAFADLYGVPNVSVGQMVKLATVQGVDLYTVWVRGDHRYLQNQTPYPDTKTRKLLEMIQVLADETAEFFVRKGQGKGNISTNIFVRELNHRAKVAFGQDYSEQKICGDTNHAVDYYFEDEATIVEVALSLWTPNSEFEKDILKALMAQESYPVQRLVLIGKKGSVMKCSMPSRKSIINWAERTHNLKIDVYDIENSYGS